MLHLRNDYWITATNFLTGDFRFSIVRILSGQSGGRKSMKSSTLIHNYSCSRMRAPWRGLVFHPLPPQGA